jgi:adenine-specific DNA-methyltransferase
LARELLTETGSVFVQISDENVHRVRELMDEIFRARNFVRLITFTKTGSIVFSELGRTSDYLLWYAREKSICDIDNCFDDEELIEAYRGTVSLPFELGGHKRIAVKIIDDRGIESLKVMEVE